jgi:Bifunctional DNA primase/polymerase, N-terminal
MSGVFAEWQPRYAERRVATFPVENKLPRVRHWQRVGLRGSSQLAMKFADADAFGFQCGKRSRITLIDIDSYDERLVDEAVKLFGQSPILWRTGGGNFAMPFRHNGEARRIRPLPELPIDVLGGGYAVAPPSMGAKGRYEFLRGTLADLDRLPVARVDGARSPDGQSDTNDRIAQGKRDDTLFHFALEQVQHVDDLDALLDAVGTRNMDCEPPLPEFVVMAKARSAWRYQQEGRNLVGLGRALVTPHDTYDVLWHEDRDALALYLHLCRHHWGREFVLAKAMTTEMAWGLRRWKAARDALVARCHLLQPPWWEWTARSTNLLLD